jgi:uridine kinase
MKICILLCGLKRCIDLVINNLEDIFIEHDINIITCLNSVNENIETIFTGKNIIKKLFVKDKHNNLFRNSLNYCNKIYNGLKIIENGYDLYIIMRTDLIITDIIINNINNIENNKLYFSNKNINQFTKENSEKVNDNIILTRDYNLLMELINLYDFAKINVHFLDIVLYNFLNTKHIDYELININYKLILSKCNVIAIAGDSGSGKSTLLKVLEPLFGNSSNVLTLETDRYHKWERGNENYQKYTHLNPYANHLEKMYEDVYDLKIGNEIYQVDYDHHTGKFTQKEKIVSKKNVIICGLHTLYDDKIKGLLDIKIYVDTERDLLKKWKIQRDVTERGYSMEKVLAQIKIREKDYEEHILLQKEKSDIIINFYEDSENIIQCNFIINNPKLINKLLKNLVELNYHVQFEGERLIIKLKNDIRIENNIINNIFNKNKDIFKSNHYREIYNIIYLLTI